jgi:hypothetical protein
VIGGNQALNSEQLVSTTGINLRSTLNHKFNHYDRRSSLLPSIQKTGALTGAPISTSKIDRRTERDRKRQRSTKGFSLGSRIPIIEPPRGSHYHLTMEDYRCVAHRVCSEGASDTTKRWYLGYMKHCIIENYDGQTSWFNIIWGTDSQSCRQFQRSMLITI